MSCPTRAFDDDAIHGYVAGTLPASEVEAFELHLLGCRSCREAVRLGLGVRVEIGAPARASRTRAAFIGGVLMLAAASIVAVILSRAGDGDGLASFTPPPFAGVPVRRGADVDSARALVDRGMAAYQDGDFAAAARLLGTGAGLDASPGVSFYLSVAQLANGDAVNALQSARRAGNPPDNPFAADAAVVGAKAWLRLGRFDSAVAELGRAPRDGPGSARAAALLDSIRGAKR